MEKQLTARKQLKQKGIERMKPSARQTQLLCSSTFYHYSISQLDKHSLLYLYSSDKNKNENKATT